MTFCILIKTEKEIQVVGPFLTAQDAARFVTDKFTTPLRSVCSIIPMVSLSSFTGNGGPIEKIQEIIVNGRHVENIKERPNFNASIGKRDNDTVIRVDDSKHPEFWMEIVLKNQQIVQSMGLANSGSIPDHRL